MVMILEAGRGGQLKKSRESETDSTSKSGFLVLEGESETWRCNIGIREYITFLTLGSFFIAFTFVKR